MSPLLPDVLISQPVYFGSFHVFQKLQQLVEGLPVQILIGLGQPLIMGADLIMRKLSVHAQLMAAQLLT